MASASRATAKKSVAKKPARKTAMKKSAAKKSAARKTTAKKAAARKTTTRKTATKKTAAKKVAAKKTVAKKTVAKKAITPRRALANTRKLLRAKQEKARQVPAWQALDAGHATVPQSGFQSDEARIQAAHLHEAESRLEGIQGSISTHDRHNQGKRDQRS